MSENVAANPREAFAALQRLAVVGASRKNGFGKTILKELKGKGYQVFPVNPKAESIEGERCYKTLDELPNVDGVVVVVPPEQAEKVVADCGRLGLKRVWLQQGAESPKVLEGCRQQGIDAIHDSCILMYAKPGFPHTIHRFVWKLVGKY